MYSEHVNNFESLDFESTIFPIKTRISYNKRQKLVVKMDATHQLKSELYELTGFYPRPLGLSQFTRRLAQLEFFKESKNRVIHQFISVLFSEYLLFA